MVIHLTVLESHKENTGGVITTVVDSMVINSFSLEDGEMGTPTITQDGRLVITE